MGVVSWEGLAHPQVFNTNLQLITSRYDKYLLYNVVDQHWNKNGISTKNEK